MKALLNEGHEVAQKKKEDRIGKEVKVKLK